MNISINNKTQNLKLMAKVICLSIPIYALIFLAGYEMKLSIDILNTINSNNKTWKVNYDTDIKIMTNLCNWNSGDCITNCDVTKPCVDLKKGYKSFAIMTIVSIAIVFAYFLTLLLYYLWFLLDPSSDREFLERLALFAWICLACLYVIYMIFYILMVITLYDYEFDLEDNHFNDYDKNHVNDYILRIGDSEIVNSLKYYWNVTSIGWLLSSYFCVFGIIPIMIFTNRIYCVCFTSYRGRRPARSCCACCIPHNVNERDDCCCSNWKLYSHNDEHFSQILFTENLSIDCILSLLIIIPYTLYCVFYGCKEFVEVHEPDQQSNVQQSNVQQSNVEQSNDQQSNVQKSNVQKSVDVNCVVCLTTLKCIMVLPCSHVLYCTNCYKEILANKINKCAICREPVISTQHVFI
jgi:hypothetical protein